MAQKHLEKEDRGVVTIEPIESERQVEARDRPVAEAEIHKEAQVVARRRSIFIYVLLPVVFLTAALLGGLRLASPDGAFIFVRPALICLVFAAITLVLFVRGNLITVEGWFSEDRSSLSMAAGAAVVLSLFAATVQLFNSLLPESGILFYVVGFCFFWTLWTYLFADFEARRLVRSLGAVLGMAFVVKYLLLANVTAPANEGWLQGLLQNPSKEVFTWLFDLPRYSGGTGYIQFFTLVLYLAGLYFLPRSAPPNAA
jgi:hypothetical protein